MKDKNINTENQTYTLVHGYMVFVTRRRSLFQSTPTIYLCRGRARDLWTEYHGDAVMTTVDIMIPSDEDPKKWAYPHLFYCIQGKNEEGKSKFTSYYPEEEEAWEASKDFPETYSGNLILRTAFVVGAYIPEVTYPIYVTLNCDQPGKYYTRINIHPEWDGVKAPGKICFPDNRNRGTVGRYMKVTDIRERERCAFLVGEYLDTPTPSVDEIMDYTLEHCDAWNLLCICREPDGVLRFFLRGTAEHREIVRCLEGGMLTAVYRTSDSIEDTVKHFKRFEGRLGDIWLAYAHENWSSVESIHDAIKPCRFDFRESRTATTSLETPMQYTTFALGDEVLDAACEEEICRQIYFPEYDIIVLSPRPDRFHRLCSFSEDEITHLIEAINNHNAESEERLRNLIKKGRLRIVERSRLW